MIEWKSRRKLAHVGFPLSRRRRRVDVQAMTVQCKDKQNQGVADLASSFVDTSRVHDIQSDI